MEDLNHPLSEEEIERLDQFLLNRVDDQFVAEGMDEGIFDISTLDGFLTAIASGPVTIPPSVWLPSIWGDFEPEWENEEAFSEILSLLIRHLNGIVTTLMEYPEDFEPLYLERIVENKTVLIVDEWCEGYHRGTELSPDHWRSGGKKMAALLSPILAFTAATDWKGHDKSYDVVESIQLKIAPNARQIHAYWLSRRDEIPQDELIKKREQTPVGRNDPCPCGSGKKYKKCCLH
ncbi:MAG: YecA family protein [gamma proteobacterium symbiont of Ctena orbiculata]|nr:MAG: YecA family protein [gamma proteobacterium symbiont of Ctena orbiculata]PUB86028.1 MAG: YecA family protein [gamma proteobacterium symbiont of Ctena orbiculata]